MYELIDITTTNSPVNGHSYKQTHLVNGDSL